jgi:mono/diheme cytochrome c family protein
MLAAAVAGCLLAAPSMAADGASGQFEKTVRPLLARKCFECHSSKAEELQGNLKLETLDDILKGGDNGPAVTPGDVKGSFLLRAIRYEVEDYEMPPSGRLSDEEIAAIEAWVKALRK